VAPSTPSAPASSAPAPEASEDRVIARNERFLIYKPRDGDTLRSIAQDFRGDSGLYWEIADFNGVRAAQPDHMLVVPLQPINAVGVFGGGYQTVPILAYHRFGEQSSRMEVSVTSFAAQLDYLAQNDYRVVALRDLEGFLAGKHPLPERAVVITMDDGYGSLYKYAFPLLREHGFPATVFVYTDFIGARDALSWAQMREMVDSGLIDIQAHSKSHANLSYRVPGETDERYKERLDEEAHVPRDVLERGLPVKVDMFAYPYGDTNGSVLDVLRKRDYHLAVTVKPGGNAFFADPLLLRRSMVLGDQDLDSFKAKLRVYREMEGRSPEIRPPYGSELELELREGERALAFMHNARWGEAVPHWEVLNLLHPEQAAYADGLVEARTRAAHAVAEHLEAAQHARKQGQTRRAAALYLSALSADPGNVEAAQALRDIQEEGTRREYPPGQATGVLLRDESKVVPKGAERDLDSAEKEGRPFSSPHVGKTP